MQKHIWEFRPRFRRGSFGWKSQPAITRVKEAVTEIKRVAKTDAELGAEGAILFLERVSPALEKIDSSSGAIGSAVNHAIEELVPIIARAPATHAVRAEWLERLFTAYQDDRIPYIEALGDHWGELCAGKELASFWADSLVGTVKQAWSPGPSGGGFFAGTSNCLSALVAAERYDEALALLEMAPYRTWSYRRYGVAAWVGKGQWEKAVSYAEAGRGLNDSETAIACACEEILLANGRIEEAYERYGLLANWRATYLATLRTVAKKYPHKSKETVLRDLVERTAADEGKWFAAAKDAGLFEQALAFAGHPSADPKTLARAARDYADKRPDFALEVGLLALQWMVKGFGYDVTSIEIKMAYNAVLQAAVRCGGLATARDRVRRLIEAESAPNLVGKLLHPHLSLP